jgi:hypothetical protein
MSDFPLTTNIKVVVPSIADVLTSKEPLNAKENVTPKAAKGSSEKKVRQRPVSVFQRFYGGRTPPMTSYYQGSPRLYSASHRAGNTESFNNLCIHF